ncbi:MAG: glycosyltransferase, partial [Acetobacteraceae bacterium]
MHFSLIVPAPLDAVSGGYAYDRRIVAGLREAGHTVRVAELAGTHPLTDATARDAARAAWHSITSSSRPIIDGLALPAFIGLDDALTRRDAIGLIHHPTALETGFVEGDRTALLGIEKRLLPRLARIIVTSEPTAEQLAGGFGVDRARIRVVVPGTDDAARSTGS